MVAESDNCSVFFYQGGGARRGRLFFPARGSAGVWAFRPGRVVVFDNWAGGGLPARAGRWLVTTGGGVRVETTTGCGWFVLFVGYRASDQQGPRAGFF